MNTGIIPGDWPDGTLTSRPIIDDNPTPAQQPTALCSNAELIERIMALDALGPDEHDGMSTIEEWTRRRGAAAEVEMERRKEAGLA